MTGFECFQRLLNRIAYGAPGGYGLRPWLQRKRGVSVGKNVWISRLVYIDELHPEAVSIGDNSTIGMRTSLIVHLYWGPRRDSEYRPITVADNVYVGPHCLILPGVMIGEGSVIRGGSTVTRSVPAQTLWGGVDRGPIARVTVPLTPQHSYEEFTRGLRPFRKRKKEEGANE
jgi:acetyltransferase-like isoleucine patch superfamily enzyme